MNMTETHQDAMNLVNYYMMVNHEQVKGESKRLN